MFSIVFFGPSFSTNFKILNNADVNFRYFIAGIPFRGEFKVTESSFDIDFEQPSKSMFSVKFDLMQSNAGFPMAKTAMEEVLDASNIPKSGFCKKLSRIKENFLAAASLEVTGISKPFILFVTINVGRL